MLKKLIEALKVKFPEADLADIEEMARVMLEEETGGLKRSRDTILSEKKKLAEEKERLEQMLEGIDPEEIPETLEQLRSFRSEKEKLEREKLTGKGQWELLEKHLREQHAAEIKKLQEKTVSPLQQQLEAITGRLHTTLRDNALAKAMSDVRVRDEDRELIENAFRGRAVVKDEDGKLRVIVSDNDGLERSVADYFTDWAQSDQGKRYIKAPDNTGGGARGGAGGGANKTTYTRTELRENPDLAKQYRERMRQGEDVHIMEG